MVGAAQDETGPFSSSVIDRVDRVTPVVDAVMARTPDPRLREITRALVKHAHAFAREVHLTEAEWEQGVAFLNRIGQATHDKHNEAVLFSDVLGVSTLVCLLNNGNNGAAEMEAALLGPFWRADSPRVPMAEPRSARPRPGPPCSRACASSTPRAVPSRASRSTCGSPRPWASTRTRTPPRPR